MGAGTAGFRHLMATIKRYWSTLTAMQMERMTKDEIIKAKEFDAKLTPDDVREMQTIDADHRRGLQRLPTFPAWGDAEGSRGGLFRGALWQARQANAGVAHAVFRTCLFRASARRPKIVLASEVGCGFSPRARSSLRHDISDSTSPRGDTG